MCVFVCLKEIQQRQTNNAQNERLKDPMISNGVRLCKKIIKDLASGTMSACCSVIDLVFHRRRPCAGNCICSLRVAAGPAATGLIQLQGSGNGEAWPSHTPKSLGTSLLFAFDENGQAFLLAPEGWEKQQAS